MLVLQVGQAFWHVEKLLVQGLATFVCSPDQPSDLLQTSTLRKGQSLMQMSEIVSSSFLFNGSDLKTNKIVFVVRLRLTVREFLRDPHDSATLAPHTDAQSLYRA